MNHAHTVPPVAVPKTSPENAPAGDTGRQPAAPSAPITGVGVGEELIAEGEETVEELGLDDVQATATIIASTAAFMPRDVSVRMISSTYTPRASRRFHCNLRLAECTHRAILTMPGVAYWRPYW